MTTKISKPSVNLREELTRLKGLAKPPVEEKLYLNRNLITNGDFSNGTTGWTLNATASGSVTNGQYTITKTDSASDGVVSQTITTKPGKEYRASVNVISSGANYKFGVAGILTTSYATTTGTVDIYFTARDTTEQIDFQQGGAADPASTTTFDDVRVEELDENLVVNNIFDYDDASWSKGDGWSITGGVASCDGTQTANTSFTQSNNVLKKPLKPSTTYTLSFRITGWVSGGVNPHLRNTGYGAYISGNGFYTLTFTSGTGNNGLNFYAQSNFVGEIDHVYLNEGAHHIVHNVPHGYEVKDVYVNGQLKREGEAYDYQVKTDGLNQWIKPSVAPAITNETVVIGVRK